jgi:hypothetical protein
VRETETETNKKKSIMSLTHQKNIIKQVNENEKERQKALNVIELSCSLSPYTYVTREK